MSKSSSKSGSLRQALNATCSSCHSRGSSAVNTAATMARAEAEAAKVEIVFAKKESELKIRQAQIEASLETLRLEKRVAAIQAKAEALETAAELECREKSSVIELPIEHTTEHTQAYISEQMNSVVDPQMPVLDGPFYDSGGISTSEAQQTQATECQCTLYATPPKRLSILMERACSTLPFHNQRMYTLHSRFRMRHAPHYFQTSIICTYHL